ncbi:uncharacterized protein BDR25DRAFT_355627 [Lindgomyces ingoldianus]|uniref:Uncharacterized protein n=1 Tax=Lindgomyces ingoldianus TaxID=673940 RepID=A0ACB6QW77_9PLEO|nr:uncharacterized protein BDR25DRAFT_355627 [Lindgomyces ingoldianus]KAF2470532.1 hypothetical protein BDR25DRAFT_355627 [Lindgomyces ingoldianus]
MRYESTQRHMGALYVGYQKTTELATGASQGRARALYVGYQKTTELATGASQGRARVGADTETLRIESLQ